MAGLHPSPSTPKEPRDPVAERRALRVGLVLFFLYLAGYAVYVAINAFRPAWMDAIVFSGINLAVAYGFALIAGAFVLAILYAWLCRKPNGGRA
jgi:uncharacterized membrane protein (DUF485 family)